jgi:hypothetical protein
MAAVTAKLLAEGFLFIVNFAIQRDFVFARRAAPSQATDWDKYYTNVAPTAKVTRRYTTSVLIEAIRKFGTATAAGRPLQILEIGGANSCFVDQILAAVPCSRYDVVDTNRYGLSLLEKRAGAHTVIHTHEKSVLGLQMDLRPDVVFSVGLVEHFDCAGTREAVRSHLDVLKPGGSLIITFPTPTLLYRMTRGLIEVLGLWQFPDERPLTAAEVISALQDRADVVFEKTLWPLFLTQHMIVCRTREHSTPMQPAVATETV